MKRYPWLLILILLAVPMLAVADPGHFELSVVQRAFIGPAFAGAVGSARVANVVVAEPLGKIDVFVDGGVRFSETTESSVIGGLVGASVGQRDNALRLGGGYEIPGGWTIYARATLKSW